MGWGEGSGSGKTERKKKQTRLRILRNSKNKDAFGESFRRENITKGWFNKLNSSEPGRGWSLS